MYRVQCEVVDGLIPSEKIVRIATADGHQEELAVDSSFVESDTLMTSLITQRNGEALIELPNESMSGRWRLWVRISQ